jgi:two-component system, OmpR family, sensor kinase
MFTKSIRWRLQLWLAFLLTAVLSGLGVAAYQLHRVSEYGQIDEELNRRVAVLGSCLRGPPPDHGPGRPPPFGGGTDHHGQPGGGPWESRFGRWDGPPGPREFHPSPEMAGLFDESRTDGFYYAIWYRDQTLGKASSNAPAAVAYPERNERDPSTHMRTRTEYREAYHFTEMGDCLLAGRSIAADLQAMERFTLVLLAAGAGVLAVGLGGGWWLTTRAIRPLEQISAAASRISAGNLSERIDAVEPENEIGRLAGVLNSTFARLEAAFAQQRQFTADASHELRTPLAVIISEAQTALARERSAAEYRETVEACLATAQEMRQLAESLLELARLDAGQEKSERAPVDLAELARTCVERLRPLAAERGIKIHRDLEPAVTLGNAAHIGQVITNLLTNAIHYNRPEGEIRVSTRAENGSAVLTVADTGVGLAEKDIPHIFERFYRADNSRTRADGRTGLGLAISKAIVDVHRGRIEVASQFGVGTTFTVRFPAA